MRNFRRSVALLALMAFAAASPAGAPLLGQTGAPRDYAREEEDAPAPRQRPLAEAERDVRRGETAPRDGRANETRPGDNRPAESRPSAYRPSGDNTRGTGRNDGRAGDPRVADSRNDQITGGRATDNRPAAGNAKTNANPVTANPANGGRTNSAFQPAAPFQLSPQEQQFVDELLAAWEKQSSSIKTFECEFTRWEYSPTFGPVGPNRELRATAIASGNLKYIKPDKGVFQVTETRIWSQQTSKYEKGNEDANEHWVCDGKTVWEMDAKAKQVKENLIPPQMQGEHIADGPLPFMLFGGEAAKLKARYYLRERTDPRFAKEEIWLESYPRWKGDAGNFRSAQLIMKRSDFLPYALRLYSPNGTDYTVFEFRKVKLNNVFMRDIKQPDVPRGWQLVKAQAEAAAQPQTAPAVRQGQRPSGTGPVRK